MTQAADTVPALEKTDKRNSGLDFLRGCAILLVLRQHHLLDRYTQNIGWTGVDLFFVLSGFLVSGLLFAEYKNFGFIKPFYFLARRGFKIYPLFYFSLIVSFIIYPFFVPSTLSLKGLAVDYFHVFIPEIFFLQNYIGGFWGHHWSLAVEEHFYILLAILVYVLSRLRILNNRKLLILLSVLIFGGCLLLRIFQDYHYPFYKNFNSTHLRIDSLFMGVVIAYFYHFYPDELNNFYRKFKWLLPVTFLLPFLLIPISDGGPSSFIMTFGFTLLYISFGSLLLMFLLSQTIKDKLPVFITPYVYRAICFIGIYSYSIYLFHMYIVRYLMIYITGYFLNQKHITGTPEMTFGLVMSFICYFLGSIFLGVVISHLTERPFLKLREQYFPRRT